ncbi:MAG: catalase, partial [Actinobacteria bacterium]|nr:catalase [Actinomycetota bacterium]
INQPLANVRTNQRDGQMTYYVDGGGENPHVNYEPSSLGGLEEAPTAGPPYEPSITGRLTRSAISRTNNYGQAGERYRTMPDDERDDLILNFVTLFGQCEDRVVQRMLDHFRQVDPDLARRVSEGLAMSTNGKGSAASTPEPQMAGRPQSPEA